MNKNALVVRLGAHGDLIMASTILPQLKEEGYHVTFLAQGDEAQVIAANPHIDVHWRVQKNQIPPAELQAYLLGLSIQFDRYIELNASIERQFLHHKDEPYYHYADEARARLWGGANYLEHTCDVAAVPHRFDGATFYATDEERRNAYRIRDDLGTPIIGWALSGSAAHKIWPYNPEAIVRLLNQTDAHIVLFGCGEKDQNLADTAIRQAQRYYGDASRIINAVDHWTVRQAYAFACHGCDVMVGPETGIMNAVGVLPHVAKVVMLSHSTADNLTRHWHNVTPLEPLDKRALARCRHRLHMDMDDLPTNDRGIPLVTASLPIDHVVDATKAALTGGFSVSEAA